MRTEQARNPSRHAMPRHSAATAGQHARSLPCSTSSLMRVRRRAVPGAWAAPPSRRRCGGGWPAAPRDAASPLRLALCVKTACGRRRASEDRSVAQERGVEPQPAHPRTIAPLRLWQRRGAFVIARDGVTYAIGNTDRHRSAAADGQPHAKIAKPM